MKFMRWLSGVALFFSATLAWGNGTSTVTLVEGENAIAISLVNKGNNNLQNVSASIDQSGLPRWLSIRSVSGRVDISRGMRSGDKIRIYCTVNGAQPGAEAMIPMNLKDQTGLVWNYTFLAKVADDSPIQDILFENYPNPFNPNTSISFSLKESRQTSLVIYNALGQKIRTLLNETQPAGVHIVSWNGKDDGGRMVSSGTYFYRLTSGPFVQTRRMVLVQ